MYDYRDALDRFYDASYGTMARAAPRGVSAIALVFRTFVPYQMLKRSHSFDSWCAYVGI